MRRRRCARCGLTQSSRPWPAQARRVRGRRRRPGACAEGRADRATTGSPVRGVVEALADQSELDVTLTFGVAGPPARTTVTVPAGFELFPTRPPGTFIGEIDL